jgi:hypothetical protein
MDEGAPGGLESVRTLLNTWRIPNDTRRPTDDLPALLADPSAWERMIPGIRHPHDEAGRQEVERLRGDLRVALTDGTDHLNELLADQRWHLAIDGANADEPVRWTAEPASITGDGLAIVTTSLTAGTWSRLRACPDCQWVFYDTSRNNQRTWCAMTAADGGRGCGSIAKTRAYRQRRQRRPEQLAPG